MINKFTKNNVLNGRTRTSISINLARNKVKLRERKYAKKLSVSWKCVSYDALSLGDELIIHDNAYMIRCYRFSDALEGHYYNFNFDNIFSGIT